MSPLLGRIGLCCAFAALAGTAIASPSGSFVRRALTNVTAAPQAVASTDTRVGTNLGDLRPGAGTGVVFVDAMKQATPWTSSAALKFDENGNITELAKGQRADTVIFPAERYPAGDYTLLYDGTGSFEVGAAQVVGHAAGRIVVRIAAQPGGIHLRLTATDPHNYARNVRLILPGFEATYLRQPFHPLFLRALAPFHVVRFAHWMHADTFVDSVSAPLSTAMSESQAGPLGVAPEYMIALANATGADPWFTFPMGVTNMYVSQFAQRVHERLDPRLHPIFEYGQDAWKAGSATNAYAIMAGHNFKLAADPQTAALDWYSARSVQLFGLVQQAYGPDAGRVVRVLNGPIASTPTNEALDRAILSNYGAALHADAFAVAADDDLGATAAPLLRQLSPGRALQSLDANVASSGALSVALGRTAVLLRSAHLPLIAYQGGASLQPLRAGAADPALANLFLATSRSPGIRQVNSDVIEAWHHLGGGLFVAQSLVTAPSNLGASALLEQLDQAPAGAYKLLGVGDYMQRHPAVHGSANPAAVAIALGLSTTATTAQSSVAQSKSNVLKGPRAQFAGTAAAINANGIDIDAGNTSATGSWLADADFTGGAQTTFYRSVIDTSSVSNPAPQAVYQTGRYSTTTLTYTIPGLTPGALYTVRLHFAENHWTGPNQRVFNATMSGTTQTLNNFDIFAQAGAAHKAVTSDFHNVTADAAAGTITITFTTVINAAQVNGIEIIPSSDPTPTPTPSNTPTPTPTPSSTPTPTPTPSETPTPTPTPSDTPTPTPTPSNTPRPTPTPSDTPTPTPTPSNTPRPTPTPSDTPTPTPTPSNTPRPTPTPSNTPTPTPTPSITPRPTPTPTGTATPTPSPSPTSTIDTSKDDWTTYAHDLQRTGLQSQTSGISPATVGNLSLRWAVNTGNGYFASPLVSNGLVIVVSKLGHVTALSAQTGKTVWTQNIYTATSNHPVKGTPTISNGVLYVALHNLYPVVSYLYALRVSDGSQLWTVPLAGPAHGSPIVANGAVYVDVSQADSDGGQQQTLRGGVQAFKQSDGSLLWTWYAEPSPTSTTGGAWSNGCLVGTELFYGTANGAGPSATANNVVAIGQSDGALKWTAQLPQLRGDNDFGGGVTAWNGSLLAMSKDGSLYSLNGTQGAINWQTPLGADNLFGGIATATTDGQTIVVSAGQFGTSHSTGRLVGLDELGAIKWHVDALSYVRDYAAITNGVAIANIDNKTTALSLATGQVLWSYTAANTFSSAPVVVPSGVYAADNGGFVYAFR